MRRREFITLLGGVAASWPLAARAQQGERVRHLAAMMGGRNADTDPEGRAWFAAFRQGLQELGWIEGRSFRADYRWPAGEPDRMRLIAKEFVNLKPDVLFAGSTPAVLALLQETQAIPIARTCPIKAVEAHAREGGTALVALPDGFTLNNRAPLLALAARHRLPAIYSFRIHAIEGGLLSYGPATVDLYRRAASYVDRVLKGEKPADLPVQAPTKYELVINLKTAKALGIDMPPTLLARADEVIE